MKYTAVLELKELVATSSFFRLFSVFIFMISFDPLSDLPRKVGTALFLPDRQSKRGYRKGKAFTRSHS